MSYDYSKGTKFIAYDTAMGNVSKTRQVVMLYDGIISFIQRAKEALIKKNFQDNYNFIDRATKIITGLHSSLDKENGGDVAKALDSFYIDLHMKLINLVQNKNEADYDKIAEEVKSMRAAWDTVDAETTAKKIDNLEANLANNNSESPAPPSGISVSV